MDIHQLKVVTFDFDDVLLQTVLTTDGDIAEGDPNIDMVDRARELIAHGVAVHVVTSRIEVLEDACPSRTSVRVFLEQQGLQVSGIHFTNGKPKRDTVLRLRSQLHFDDDPEELALLGGYVRTVLVPLHASWRNEGSGLP